MNSGICIDLNIALTRIKQVVVLMKVMEVIVIASIYWQDPLLSGALSSLWSSLMILSV